MPSSLSRGYPCLSSPWIGVLLGESDSYLYEELVAAAIEPYAADRDGVSAKVCDNGIQVMA